MQDGGYSTYEEVLLVAGPDSAGKTMFAFEFPVSE